MLTIIHTLVRYENWDVTIYIQVLLLVIHNQILKEFVNLVLIDDVPLSWWHQYDIMLIVYDWAWWCQCDIMLTNLTCGILVPQVSELYNFSLINFNLRCWLYERKCGKNLQSVGVGFKLPISPRNDKNLYPWIKYTMNRW